MHKLCSKTCSNRPLPFEPLASSQGATRADHRRTPPSSSAPRSSTSSLSERTAGRPHGCKDGGGEASSRASSLSPEPSFPTGNPSAATPSPSPSHLDVAGAGLPYARAAARRAWRRRSPLIRAALAQIWAELGEGKLPAAMSAEAARGRVACGGSGSTGARWPAVTATVRSRARVMACGGSWSGSYRLRSSSFRLLRRRRTCTV
uniref:Uncharacterized protein n=1 Tax=Setaria italica TaxID=4555 RepID=K3ZX04_SETIT